ncbi:MAG: GNAT family N-acetyltransferase [Chloroflexota bacterium]
MYGIVQEMYVRPEQRGQKIGVTLQMAVFDEAHSRECRSVQLGTPLDGTRQVERYEDNGLRDAGAHLCWSAPNHPSR